MITHEFGLITDYFGSKYPVCSKYAITASIVMKMLEFHHCSQIFLYPALSPRHCHHRTWGHVGSVGWAAMVGVAHTGNVHWLPGSADATSLQMLENVCDSNDVGSDAKPSMRS